MLNVQCNATIGSLRVDAAFTVSRPWTVLFGPSGSGKSSLLRLIAGLWQPAQSRVLVDADDVAARAPHQRRIALVAQQPALFPHLSVRENVAFGIPAGGGTPIDVDALLHRFRMSQESTQRPRALSGGEIKRVAIARAVVAQPRFLLLDEVFNGMDSDLALNLRAELRSWQGRTGVPILAVTHDVAEALDADEVIRIESGRITAQGDPAVVLQTERETLLRALTARETP